MKFFHASPLLYNNYYYETQHNKAIHVYLGAILAYVNSGIAIARSVFTIAFPLAGTIVSTALDKSYPAENSEPLVGMMAFSDSFFTRNTSAGNDENTVDMALFKMQLPMMNEYLDTSLK